MTYTIQISDQQLGTVLCALNYSKLVIQDAVIEQEIDEVYWHILQTATKHETSPLSRRS
jgi:hypothetical protein